jgi:hypothetical protein
MFLSRWSVPTSIHSPPLSSPLVYVQPSSSFTVKPFLILPINIILSHLYLISMTFDYVILTENLHYSLCIYYSTPINSVGQWPSTTPFLQSSWHLTSV